MGMETVVRLPGRLIVFEGIDGSGKSTQAALAHKRLIERGTKSILLFEPTRGEYGAQLRASFFGPRLSPEDELSLFTLDRKDDLARNIIPALERGETVILDRYYFSTAAYQGARGLDAENILREQERFAYIPDLVFLIDIPVGTALERIRRNRSEGANSFEQEAYLTRVRELFLSFQRDYLHIFHGETPVEELSAAIVKAIFF
ncbi:MAG: dTMP kinase [Spirochaetes bacterium]|nr:dTMP kinase [Spirochaetota bacterium]